MRRIDSPSGFFVDGNAGNGTPGTILTAAWLNAVQEEIISVLSAAGVAIDAAKTDQLSTAINTLLRGRATVNVAGGAGVTLTLAQHTLPILILTGALTANINVIFPASGGIWIVRNQTTGAFTVTCKTAAGAGVLVRQGLTQTIWSDGVNVLEADAGKADKADVVSGGRQQFTASGSFVVPAGVYRVCVTLAGGGGGGAGAISGNSYVPGGGGAGEVRYREWLAVTPGQSITVTIGVGGAGGIGSTAGGSYSTSNGGAGGASSFGALLTASGGGGGRCQPSDSVGGVAVGPYAGDGQDGDSATVTAMGAAGGGNLLAPSVYADYNTGGVARGYGSGGGGGRPGTSYWQNGMAGGAGVCIVEW